MKHLVSHIASWLMSIPGTHLAIIDSIEMFCIGSFLHSLMLDAAKLIESFFPTMPQFELQALMQAMGNVGWYLPTIV